MIDWFKHYVNHEDYKQLIEHAYHKLESYLQGMQGVPKELQELLELLGKYHSAIERKAYANKKLKQIFGMKEESNLG